MYESIIKDWKKCERERNYKMTKKLVYFNMREENAYSLKFFVEGKNKTGFFLEEKSGLDEIK